MNVRHSLARWLFPSTMTTMEMKIEHLQEENLRLKRHIQGLERKLEKNPMLFPAWSIYDWDRAYGKTEE